MSIRTSRTSGTARVTVRHEKCILCGLCVKVCMGNTLTMKENRHVAVLESADSLFGCVGCGQCMAVCPQNCITVEGRCLSPEDCMDLTGKKRGPDFEHLETMMAVRRSIRHYRDREVEHEILEKILNAAANAPSGIPPTDVRVLVVKGKHNVRQFAFDTLDSADRFRWMFSPWMGLLMRPFMGKETVELLRDFVRPVINCMLEAKKNNRDLLLYDAPVALVFYGSGDIDSCEPYIAATYAMLAAESLGLGSCMIGCVYPFLRADKALRNKYGINTKSKNGLVLILGYPDVHYDRGIQRNFAELRYFGDEPKSTANAGSKPI